MSKEDSSVILASRRADFGHVTKVAMEELSDILTLSVGLMCAGWIPNVPTCDFLPYISC